MLGLARCCRRWTSRPCFQSGKCLPFQIQAAHRVRINARTVVNQSSLLPIRHSSSLPSSAGKPASPNKSEEIRQSLENTSDESADLIDDLPDLEPASAPWYLQLPEESDERLLPSSRQTLPEVPEDAPERLATIMEHLYKDIGLDDLRLYDMRHLDPPLALGSNLFMVIGSARSEKHLNVSADRFCRWLRSQYKLQPRADGLIGRGEMKVKLRRRARRAKLLGSMRPAAVQDDDDGLHVGWICVTVGNFEGNAAREVSLASQGIQGFGIAGGGANLAVQIMTEKRRAEVDLETLWDKALQRQARFEARLAAEIENADISPEPDITDQPSAAPLVDLPATNVSSSSVSG